MCRILIFVESWTSEDVRGRAADVWGQGAVSPISPARDRDRAKRADHPPRLLRRVPRAISAIMVADEVFAAWINNQCRAVTVDQESCHAQPAQNRPVAGLESFHAERLCLRSTGLPLHGWTLSRRECSDSTRNPNL